MPRDRLAAWKSLSAATRWRIAFAAIAAALVAWLIAGDKPWNLGPAENWRLKEILRFFSWSGGAFDLAVILVLAAICPWWSTPLPRRPLNIPPAFPWFRRLVFLAMALAAFQAVQRLDFSLWDDEELSARYSTVGKFKAKPGEIPRFDPVRWDETFFDYRTPNNHILHSILSRASVDIWRAITKPKGLPFSESALRLPAFVFGILAVAAIAWFLKDAGFAAAGVIAAFLLALHPWHLRYASEARGYSIVVCLVPVLFVCWRRAIAGGSWKWWAAFAATEFALIYTYPGTLFPLIVLNVLALPALFLIWRENFLAALGRWFCVNTLAALTALPLMLPLMPQAKAYFDFEGAKGALVGWPWIQSALSHLLSGAPWKGGAGYPALGVLFSQQPLPVSLLIGFAILLLALGAVRFGRGGWTKAALAFILVTPLLTFFLARARSIFIYEAYIIYALPGIVALIAVGIAWIGELARHRGATPIIAFVFVLGYFVATHPLRSDLCHHPLQQIRESVLASRGSLDPKDTAILTGSFCIPPYLYDASMVRADSADEFIALLRRADAENRPLYINIGMPWAAREYSPKMWALFHDQRLFENHQNFRGFDAGLDRIVARYKPGSAATFDFKGFAGPER